jgi:pimeloyl-ACP methyl ester carboxylesterase
MPTIDLPHGTVHYRVAGPEQATTPPVVFVHGFLVSATLWGATADALALAGLRSYAPDLPLGSHTIALGERADQSPRGVARQVIAFIEALGLTDVTLVGNDTGGAICQFLLDSDASRIGRVVLTNCDAFTNFPPAPFGQLFKAFRNPTAIRALMAPMRATAVRHSQRRRTLCQAGRLAGPRCRIQTPRRLPREGAAGLGRGGSLLQARLRPPAARQLLRRAARRGRARADVHTARRARAAGERDRRVSDAAVRRSRSQRSSASVALVLRAASGSRTRDLELGKLALYQLSYRRAAQIVRDRLYPFRQ